MLGEDNSDYVKAIKIDNAKDTNERISTSPVRR